VLGGAATHSTSSSGTTSAVATTLAAAATATTATTLATASAVEAAAVASAPAAAGESPAKTASSASAFNAQLQSKIVNQPSFAVARSFVDQAERDGSLAGKALTEVRKHVDQAEKLAAGPANSRAVQAQLDNAARKSGLPADSAVVQAIKALAAALS